MRIDTHDRLYIKMCSLSHTNHLSLHFCVCALPMVIYATRTGHSRASLWKQARTPSGHVACWTCSPTFLLHQHLPPLQVFVHLHRKPAIYKLIPAPAHILLHVAYHEKLSTLSIQQRLIGPSCNGYALWCTYAFPYHMSWSAPLMWPPSPWCFVDLYHF